MLLEVRCPYLIESITIVEHPALSMEMLDLQSIRSNTVFGIEIPPIA